MDTNELILEEQKDIQKKKNKKPFIFALFALVICLVSGIFIYESNPVHKLQRYLDKQEYENAVIIYNEKILGGSDEDTFNPIFLEHITTVSDSWIAEEIDYKEAAALLMVIEGINNKDISQEATAKKVFILLEGENSELHLKAEECYSSEDYIGAMAIVKTLNPEYS